MPRYIVTVKETSYVEYKIEAASKKEAAANYAEGIEISNTLEEQKIDSVRAC